MHEFRESCWVAKVQFASIFVCKISVKLKAKLNIQNIILEKNSKGLILKIGTRRSNNYSRVYQGKNFLKFEHEMKGKFIQEY